MRKAWKILCLVCVMMVLCAGTVMAKSVEEKRTETREKAKEVLAELYEQQPNARYEVENSSAYAVFFNTGIKIGILGSAHGRGIAINNETDEECFMNMKELSAGLGLGVKEYSLVFIFEDQDVWNHFTSGDWTCGGGSASAGATDGESGGGIEGAVKLADGIWVYQMTTKGITLEASLNGTKFTRDKKLNGEK
ncbi:lipid-binding SYLF domain-containing protein [Schwartzia sp. (in: firmicutes)]|nr:hypothetical protein [Ruminococcus sp.]